LAGATTAAYFDQEELLTSTYGAYRARTLTMVVIGLGAVLLLLILRHRRVDLALAASVPAALAALTTLGVLGLLGMTANLMHLVALLLILSMGVDYGVFIVEHRDDPQATRATLVGLVAACLTTVLSFGLLAASDNPALSSLGLSLAIGVILAVGLAPAAGILVAKR
jgi:predicted exporter